MKGNEVTGKIKKDQIPRSMQEELAVNSTAAWRLGMGQLGVSKFGLGLYHHTICSENAIFLLTQISLRCLFTNMHFLYRRSDRLANQGHSRGTATLGLDPLETQDQRLGFSPPRIVPLISVGQLMVVNLMPRTDPHTLLGESRAKTSTSFRRSFLSRLMQTKSFLM